MKIENSKKLFASILLKSFTRSLSPAESYVKHPNSYLPKYNVQSETDGETTPLNANNRDSGGSNVFESEDELDDHIEEEGKQHF